MCLRYVIDIKTNLSTNANTCISPGNHFQQITTIVHVVTNNVLSLHLKDKKKVTPCRVIKSHNFNNLLKTQMQKVNQLFGATQVCFWMLLGF